MCNSGQEIASEAVKEAGRDLFKGWAKGALTLSARGAGSEVVEQSAGSPGVVVGGVFEPALTLIDLDGFVRGSVSGGGQFVGRVYEHLLEFPSGGAWHTGSLAGLFALLRTRHFDELFGV